MHPDDERYQQLVGKNVILPLVGRKIPIVADEYSDPEKGSGAVKITPAHDFNDFEVGNRHGLPGSASSTRKVALDLLDNEDYLRDLPEGASQFAEEFNKLDRFAARKRIVERLEGFGFVERIEPHTHMVPHGDRSGSVIEPYLTDQWYVDAKTLAKPAIAAVRSGETTFVPKNWEKTYFEWMENIQPWCISRQLWWGHQIPAWYGPTARCSSPRPRRRPSATRSAITSSRKSSRPSRAARWRSTATSARASSRATRTCSTPGSPRRCGRSRPSAGPRTTPEVKRYYPTNALVTGFDIIFFWVARMMMMGLHFMKEVPFSTIYIHALVRDEKGAKMSKSKGNVIDPLQPDRRIRRRRAALHAGRDGRAGPRHQARHQRVEGYRNFATKLWNACRFAEMNDCAVPDGFRSGAGQGDAEPLDRA